MSKLDISQLNPGDIVVVGMGIKILQPLIWLQAVISGNFKYRAAGHVIVVHHRDAENRLWGIEAQALGIGWVDMQKHDGKWGVANSAQPRSEEVNAKITDMAFRLLGTTYDYLAYLDFALNAVGITKTWKDFDGNDVPVSLICSAVADYIYESNGLPNPGGDSVTRYTTPADWAKFIDSKKWESVA